MRITTMPILVEILFFMLGLAFTLFGYFIFFKRIIPSLMASMWTLRQAKRMNPMPVKLALLSLFLVLLS